MDGHIGWTQLVISESYATCELNLYKLDDFYIKEIFDNLKKLYYYGKHCTNVDWLRS